MRRVDRSLSSQDGRTSRSSTAIRGRAQPVVDLLSSGIEASGGRVVSCSFPDQRVAPIFLGAEDEDGHRYGLLAYPVHHDPSGDQEPARTPSTASRSASATPRGSARSPTRSATILPAST